MYALRTRVPVPKDYPFHAKQTFTDEKSGLDITVTQRRIIDCVKSLEDIEKPYEWVQEAKAAIAKVKELGL